MCIVPLALTSLDDAEGEMRDPSAVDHPRALQVSPARVLPSKLLGLTLERGPCHTRETQQRVSGRFGDDLIECPNSTPS